MTEMSPVWTCRFSMRLTSGMTGSHNITRICRCLLNNPHARLTLAIKGGAGTRSPSSTSDTYCMDSVSAYGWAAQFQVCQAVVDVPVSLPSRFHILVSHTVPVAPAVEAAGSGVAAA